MSAKAREAVATSSRRAEASTPGETIAAIRKHVPREFSRVTDIIARVDAAAAVLSLAFAGSGNPTLVRRQKALVARPIDPATRWSWDVIGSCHDRLTELSLFFRSDWSPVSEKHITIVEIAIFKLLLPLTPVEQQLGRLLRVDRKKGFHELGRQLDVIKSELEAARELIVSASSADREQGDADDGDTGFAAAARPLLDRAGGAWSLTEAASAMKMTRQGLHKKIHAGSALGMMLDGEIVVPKLQFADGEGKASGKRVVLPGIDKVVKLFRKSEAGPWSTLQFLVDRDPNLERAPIEVLRAGDFGAVEQAARTYLGADEG